MCLPACQPELSRLSLAGVLADMRTSMMAEVDFTQVGGGRAEGRAGSYALAWQVGAAGGAHELCSSQCHATSRLFVPPLLNNHECNPPAQEATHYQHFATFLDSRGYRNIATTPFIYKNFSSRR